MSIKLSEHTAAKTLTLTQNVQRLVNGLCLLQLHPRRLRLGRPLGSGEVDAGEARDGACGEFVRGRPLDDHSENRVATARHLRGVAHGEDVRDGRCETEDARDQLH